MAESAGTDRPVLATGEPVVRDIAVDFLEQFVEVVQRWGVRGKFSVLPFPAARGPIDQGWPGCDEAALGRWLDLVRRHVAPRMDITRPRSSPLYVCLAVALANAIFVILVFTFYISVARDLSSRARFAEMALISLTVAAVTFALGWLIRRFLGVDV